MVARPSRCKSAALAAKVGCAAEAVTYTEPAGHRRRTRAAPVKLFLVEAIVLFLLLTVVMAVVFRNRRAAETLRFMQRVGLGYVVAIVLLGVLRGLGYW